MVVMSDMCFIFLFLLSDVQSAGSSHPAGQSSRPALPVESPRHRQHRCKFCFVLFFLPSNQPSHSCLFTPMFCLWLYIYILLFHPLMFWTTCFKLHWHLLLIWKSGFCKKPLSLLLRLLCSFNEGSWRWGRWWTRAQCWSSHSRLRSSWWSAAPKETSWRVIRSVNPSLVH